MFNALRKKINVDSMVYPWNVGLTCGSCSQQFTVVRRKKLCVFCNSSYCSTCIQRRPDKRLSCKKCIVLTARPIDRDQLFHLKSRELVDYLSSRHISTVDCIEKEDLVNAVIRSVNAPPNVRRSGSGSYPPSPQRHSAPSAPSTSRSQEDIRFRHLGTYAEMRVDHSSSSSISPESSEFVVVEPADCSPEVPVVAAPTSSNAEDTATTEMPDPEPPRKRLQIKDIRGEDELDGLSIRQLKELLAFNRIDFTGCVEKGELLQKVQRLWSDYSQRRKDVEKLSHSELCKICMDAPIECVLLECGHVATCVLCGKQLSECPICRQFVVRCVRTFKA